MITKTSTPRLKMNITPYSNGIRFSICKGDLCVRTDAQFSSSDQMAAFGLGVLVTTLCICILRS